MPYTTTVNEEAMMWRLGRTLDEIHDDTRCSRVRGMHKVMVLLINSVHVPNAERRRWF